VLDGNDFLGRRPGCLWPLARVSASATIVQVFEDLTGAEETIAAVVADLVSAAPSGEALRAAVMAFARLASLAEAGRAMALDALDREGSCEHEYGLTAASWLAREAKLAGALTRRELTTGRALRELPVMASAVVSGTVDTDHVRALASASNPQVADAVAQLQPELVALAEGSTFERWRAEVRGIIELLDDDGGHDPAQDETQNRLSVSDVGGTLHLRGQFVGETALVLRAALDTRTDELFHGYHRDREACSDIAIPAAPQLRAEALAELCRAGGAVDLRSTRPPRPEVTMVIAADDPLTVAAGHSGARLGDGTVRTLRCDADLHALVVDSLGRPLHLGRNVRRATAAQHKAMAARDGGCVFPGCTAPQAWTDAHHVRHFRTGGRTDVENLASLCRRHHGITHRRGWAMRATPDGWWWWRSPSGRTFWSQRHQRRRNDPIPDHPADAGTD
jgi:hypothetical protein